MNVGDLLQLTSHVLYSRDVEEICAEEAAAAAAAGKEVDLDEFRRKG